MLKEKSHFIIYILVVTIVMLLLFEFAILPRYFKLPRSLALNGFAATPGITIDNTSINPIGFTGDVINTEKDPETIRILTLGGSVIFNRRMTERLKESLNSVSSRPIEILGAALRTHTSMSSLLKYEALSKYGFDYIIIYHGINDLFVNHVKHIYFKSDYSHMLPWYKRTSLLNNSLVARLIYNNFIWEKKIFGMEKVWYIYPKENENAMDFVSEKLLTNNLSKLVEEINRNGGVPILMTFAWNIPDHYSQELFISDSVGYAPTDYEKYPVELWGSVEFVKEGLRRHNSAIRMIADRFNLHLIDQENLMGNDLRWFEDICHFSEDGTDSFIQNINYYFLKHNLL